MTDAPQIADAPAPPSTPAEAVTRLNELKATPAWRDGFLAGQPAQMREYGDLQALIEKGDDVGIAMSGVLPDFADAGLREMAGTAEMLKGMGFTPLSIRETLSGKEASQVDVDLANKWRAENLGSKDFVDRLLRGEPVAVRELMIANVILSSPLKTEGKA